MQIFLLAVYSLYSSTRSGSQIRRTTTGLDTPRHRTSNTEWNRSCSTARRIRKVVPHSKILFVTQESSGDVAQEALGLGHLATLSRRMPEESYWLLWKLCVRAGSLSVLDWQVTFPPNLATVTSANLSTLMRPLHRYWRKQTKSSSRAFLLSGTHGIASQTERNTSVDRRATFGLRVD
jgi:hypothetical protein